MIGDGWPDPDLAGTWLQRRAETAREEQVFHDDCDDRRRSTLPDVLLRHIEEVYGGNQAEFARVIDISPQHLGAILSGKIRVPRAELRRTLGRELGLSQIRLLALAGEVDPDDPELPPDPPAALARLVAILRDPRMGPEQLETVEAVVHSLLVGADASAGSAEPKRRPPSRARSGGSSAGSASAGHPG